MEFGLASMADLPQLRSMYRSLVRHMEEGGIAIWDEVYPCEFLQADIAAQRLFILREKREIIAAFALCPAAPGQDQMAWADRQARALYLDRFGVNTAYLRRGVGSVMLQRAIAAAGARQAAYLRLFVVDINRPAIRLYVKNGFRQAAGVFHEKIDEELTLREYGFEIETGGPPERRISAKECIQWK